MEENKELKDQSEVIGNPRVCMLTDELISTYTEDNVLTDYRDIDLRIESRITPYPKGVYDQDIFGSIFSNRCNCGTVTATGLRCPRCGSVVLTEIESFKRFARIELPLLYITRFKLKNLLGILKENFSIATRFTSKQYEETPWNDPRALDICQWEWDPEKEVLTITDEITDFQKCSYEGLMRIISEFFPEMVKEIRSYLNQTILVVPMALRAPNYKRDGNRIKLENNSITVTYQNILYCVREYYPEVFPTLQTEKARAIFRGSLRRLISSSMHSLSQLIRSSKENFARSMQGNRLDNSGRCTVVPDPTLAADEVVIPRHLMYDSCREEFCKFLCEKKSISPAEAEVIYKQQSDLDEIQQLFDEYIEGDGTLNSGKYVLINRAPKLMWVA